MDNRIFSIKQELNTAQTIEVIILLDLVLVMHNQSKHIKIGSIEIHYSNLKVIRIINRDLEVASQDT